MTDPNAAAWAQAIIGGIAIMVSGAIAVFVPWNERRLERKRETRSRLSVSCEPAQAGGLNIRLAYRPEFLNSALGVTLSLKSPAGAYVYTEESDYDPSTGTSSSTHHLSNSPTRNGVSLTKVSDVVPAEYCGFVIVRFPDERSGPYRAQVEIDVLMHGNHLIYREKMEISPIGRSLVSGYVPNAILDCR